MGIQGYGFFAYYKEGTASWLKDTPQNSDPFGNPAQPLGLSAIQFTAHGRAAQNQGIAEMVSSCHVSTTSGLAANCTVNATNTQLLLPMHWYDQHAYSEELGIRFGYTLAFIAILTTFGLIQSI